MLLQFCLKKLFTSEKYGRTILFNRREANEKINNNMYFGGDKNRRRKIKTRIVFIWLPP